MKSTSRLSHRFLQIADRQIWQRSNVPKHLARFSTGLGNVYSAVYSFEKYDKDFHYSISKAEEFWDNAAKDIAWFKPYKQVLDNSKPPFTKWFKGGQLNTCYNALDYHVEHGRGDQTALIWDSPISGNIQKFTYAELKDQAARFARVLVNLGVKKGDRVLIYMPMIPQAAVAIYGCARIGAIHSVVFGGFAPHELARRIDDAEPKIIVTSSCGIEPNKILPYEPLVEEALEMAAHQPEKIIVVERPEQKVRLQPGRDIDWDDVINSAHPHDCVPLDSEDPLYILYTSGTTGKPKGVLRSNGGHAVALKWTMQNIYGVRAGETWWTGSDIGWVVGHSYIIYGPLLKGCTSIMFEGKPVGCPSPSTFFRIIDQYDVVSLFTAPTAIRVIKNEDPDGRHAKRYPMKCFRNLFVAGEHADNDMLVWSQKTFRAPVLDHWWQTETSWAITSHLVGLDMPRNYPFGSCGRATPGWNVKVLDDHHNECKPGEVGTIAVRLPLPPGSMATLWRDDDRFISNYFMKFKGYYDTCDAGQTDENGYITVLGRVDDVINVAGHRLSTKQLERAIALHPDVLEQAVVAMKDPIKGSTPVGLIVLMKDSERPHKDIIKEVIQMVRDDVGPVASFKKVIILPVLPKTRAGKYIRSVLQKMLDREAYTVPKTIENPDDLEAVKEILMKEEQNV